MDSEKPQHDANKSEAITRLVQLLAALPKGDVPSAIDQSEGAAFFQREDAVSRLPDIFAAAFPSENHRAAYEEALKGAFSTFDQKKTVSEFIAAQFDVDKERRKAFEQLADPLGLKSAAATAFQNSLPGLYPAETFEKKASAFYEAQHGIENLGRVALGTIPQDAAAMFGLRPEDHAALTADEILRSSNWAATQGTALTPSEWADQIIGSTASRTAADLFNDPILSNSDNIENNIKGLLSTVTKIDPLDDENQELRRREYIINEKLTHAQAYEVSINKSHQEHVRRENEKIELARRSAEASEAALEAERARTQEAREEAALAKLEAAQERENSAISRRGMWLGIIVGVISTFVSAIPYIFK